MVRLRGFQRLTSVDEAQRMFLGACPIGKLKVASVSLDLALNRILAEPVVASENLPRNDRSAVDGYAVRAEDTVGPLKPNVLDVVSSRRISKGQAAQIWTGNPVPRGANAVVMLEDCMRKDDKIEVLASSTPGQNIMQTGEDLKKGDVAVDCGVRLRPQHLGLIAALGVAKLAVFEKPQISILATGNELVETSCRPQRDQVFEVNRHLISGLCIELGVEPIDLGIVGDDCKKIERKLVEGLGSDGVITTGGTSTGILDLVPDVVNKIGRPGVIVHGVAMRPGMPTALAVVNAKPVLILSGNPVAAVFAFEVFARPLFSGMLGLREVEYRPTLKAKMTKKVATTLGRKTFVRVYAFLQEGEFSAEPISTRGSGVISTITRSNGYVVVPEDREGLNKGETVLVHVYGNVRGVDPSV